MKETPIIFSTAMMQAILDDKKTMTRRIIKPQPIDDVYDLKEHSEIPGYFVPYAKDGRVVNSNKGNRKDDCGYYCPYGVGDRLWVKETHIIVLPEGMGSPIYRADCEYEDNQLTPVKEGNVVLKWTPSIFMPRWASRELLEITDIRAERLQEITETDAIAEGIDWPPPVRISGRCLSEDEVKKIYECERPVELFSHLWDSINGKKYPWKNNHWVWPIGFRRN